jgi:hypothetical protein
MTAFSLRRLVARPLHRTAVTCHPGQARRRVPPERRTYHDWFFADPAVVEDDYDRMRRRTASGRR